MIAALRDESASLPGLEVATVSNQHDVRKRIRPSKERLSLHVEDQIGRALDRFPPRLAYFGSTVRRRVGTELEIVCERRSEGPERRNSRQNLHGVLARKPT